MIEGIFIRPSLVVCTRKVLVILQIRGVISRSGNHLRSASTVACNAQCVSDSALLPDVN